MANRIFDLQETKGTFQIKGLTTGVEKDNFYINKRTKTNKDFRAVNFGCMYDDKKTIYMGLNGMPQDNVYFSKRNQETGKNETKKVAWAGRHKANEDGWRLIGVNLGLTKTIDSDGKEVNDKKTLTPFDACEYINENMTDDMSTFIKGNIEFSSYQDNEGYTRRSVKYVPTQISLCKEVDFEEYSDSNKPTHDFTQTIVFMEINQEKENDKATGRYVVSAKIVTYSDIVDTEFVITDAKLAGLFKKNLKAYTAISVYGNMVVSHKVEETSDEDVWGATNAMVSVSTPTRTEMIITGALPSSIDRETYNSKNVSEAIAKIKNARNAEQKYSGKTNINITVDDEWTTEDGPSDDEDW